MTYRSISNFILMFFIFAQTADAAKTAKTDSKANSHNSVLGCEKAVTGKGERLKRLRSAERRDSARSANAERRLKVITSGDRKHTDGTIDPRDEFIDTADPSAPFFLTLPNGKKVVRIYLSGLRYLEGSSLDEILRGGIQTVRRIRGFYADGTELTGLYHEDSFPWDPELHVRDDGTLVGHGGLIPQVKPGHTPRVREHNAGRTRMWADIKFVEMSPGVFEEQWHFRGSLFNHTPTQNRWTAPNHFHNYGATFYRNADGSYIRDRDGNYFMIYEGVVEEKSGLPWNTEVFSIKVDPTLTRVIGPPVKVVGTYSSQLKRPFRASLRNGGRNGFLLEGGRPASIQYRGSTRWLVAVSGGDYVSTRYGIHLAMSANEDPMSAYTPVTGDDGELLDFGDELRCILNATWGPGRAAPFYDESGRMWMAIHFISMDEIPDGEVKDGWPASAEEFVRRHRRVALVPIKIDFVNGLPHLRLDATDADQEFKSALRICSKAS